MQRKNVGASVGWDHLEAHSEPQSMNSRISKLILSAKYKKTADAREEKRKKSRRV